LSENSDQNAFLSNKIKKLQQELHSSNSYIDSLYSELHEKNSPSNELQAELERRETEWLELENRYNKTIKQLQDELNAQSKKVSMDVYLAMMKESRRWKLDATEKQQKIEELTTMVGDLRDQIEKLQRSSSRKPGLKSIASITNKVRSRQVSPTYQSSGYVAPADPVAKENMAPYQQTQTEVIVVESQKSLNSAEAKPGRIADVKTTWEGRKGLRAQAFVVAAQKSMAQV
jgi:DNA repair exonuclease SbcCD ATPase subunit